MGTPHKYATVIKAWADGAEIECRAEGSNDKWLPIPDPHWTQATEYRIKPEPIKTLAYKRALFKLPGDLYITVPLFRNCMGPVYENPGWEFLRWVDTKWQQEVV